MVQAFVACCSVTILGPLGELVPRALKPAAQLAGLDRTDFLMALAREGVDAFVVDMDSLRRELAEPDGREAWSG